MTTIMVWILIGQLTNSSYSAVSIPGISTQAECQRLGNALRLRSMTCTQYEAAMVAGSGGGGSTATNYLLAE